MNKALVFNCDNSNFAFDISCIKEIRSWVASTAIPMSENSIEGIINIRGLIVPVINLFGVVNGENSNHKKAIIVVQSEKKTISFSVSGVSDIIEYEELNKKPENCFVNANYVKGIISRHNQSIFLIDEKSVVESVVQ